MLSVKGQLPPPSYLVTKQGLPSSSLQLCHAQLCHVPRARRLHPHRCTQWSIRSSHKDVYQGVYGPWSVEDEDVLEVTLYRAGLTITAFAVCSCTAGVLLGEQYPVLEGLLNPLSVCGTASFGLSLFLIHIYVTPIKRMLQALWAAGTAGGLYLMATQAEPVALHVVHNPAAVWLVGPLFAALTGVAFKEGVCYGKGEAFALCLALPATLLTHLAGWGDERVQGVMWMTLVLLVTVFAARKWSQALKDDIGDKSVFIFMKLPSEEQERLLEARRGL